MSVQIVASTRRYHENPNTSYRQPVVEIRVAGLVFTVDCKNDLDAIETAQRVSGAFAKYYGRSSTWPVR